MTTTALWHHNYGLPLHKQAMDWYDSGTVPFNRIDYGKNYMAGRMIAEESAIAQAAVKKALESEFGPEPPFNGFDPYLMSDRYHTIRLYENILLEEHDAAAKRRIIMRLHDALKPSDEPDNTLSEA